MANVTARLKDARFSETYLGDRSLVGRIYDDQHRRYEERHGSSTPASCWKRSSRTSSRRAATNFYQVESWA